MELANRVALITGSRRIGAAVAIALAGRGADVALSCHRSRDEADATADAIRAGGRRAVVIAADLSRPSECERLVNAAASELGRLDVLIHMASRYVATPLADLTAEDWDATLNVDLRAAFLCARAALPHLRAAGGGRIITVSDWLARSGRPRYPGYLPYYVAKAGIIGLTEALALETAGDGILVNAVAPGPIVAPPGMSDAELAAVEKATPLGRWGGAEEIVTAVLYLIDSDFVTGEVVRVDGGRHLK
jgi:NAD(P)-dependent dehydrogenase (short-subunit alcohol dehydrogenase family)